MACWIPGPEQLCWPANQRKPMPESPYQTAIAKSGSPVADTTPRRSKKPKEP